MLSDSPTLYYKEQESTDFITSIPATFDETVALDGEVGEYVAVARKKGETWFLGAMNNWSARELAIDCSFLNEGTYNVVIFQDGVNANTQATDYKKVTTQVKAGDTLNIQMANGGGWDARFEKQ